MRTKVHVPHAKKGRHLAITDLSQLLRAVGAYRFYVVSLFQFHHNSDIQNSARPGSRASDSRVLFSFVPDGAILAAIRSDKERESGSFRDG